MVQDLWAHDQLRRKMKRMTRVINIYDNSLQVGEVYDTVRSNRRGRVLADVEWDRILVSRAVPLSYFNTPRLTGMYTAGKKRMRWRSKTHRLSQFHIEQWTRKAIKPLKGKVTSINDTTFIISELCALDFLIIEMEITTHIDYKLIVFGQADLDDTVYIIRMS